MKKLELEAYDFVEGKKKEFKEGLREASNNMDNFLFDNLHESEERENARERLIEASMWARLAADKNGIK